MGRASRNISGKVLLYAQDYSEAMRNAIGETRRRREMQTRYNEEHGIDPKTIQKEVRDILEVAMAPQGEVSADPVERARSLDPEELQRLLLNMEEEMRLLAEELRFEEAAQLRDQIKRISEELLPGG